MKSIVITVDSIISNNQNPKPILQLFRQKPKSIKFFEPAIDLE